MCFSKLKGLKTYKYYGVKKGLHYNSYSSSSTENIGIRTYIIFYIATDLFQCLKWRVPVKTIAMLRESQKSTDS